MTRYLEENHEGKRNNEERNRYKEHLQINRRKMETRNTKSKNWKRKEEEDKDTRETYRERSE